LDFTNISDINKPVILNFAEKFVKLDYNNIFLILDMSATELSEHADFFESLVTHKMAAGNKIYIKNQSLYPAPYFLGRAGPYTFSKEAWKNYKTYIGKMYGLVCSQGTIAIDIERFFTEFGEFNVAEFNKLLFDATKSILFANSAQRRQEATLFEYFIKLNSPYEREFFNFSRNYLRIWNYGWKKPGADPRFVEDLLKSVKARITKFANFEERIYNACGMPTKFKIAFSIA